MDLKGKKVGNKRNALRKTITIFVKDFNHPKLIGLNAFRLLDKCCFFENASAQRLGKIEWSAYSTTATAKNNIMRTLSIL